MLLLHFEGAAPEGHQHGFLDTAEADGFVCHDDLLKCFLQ
jgi:hypothetical protein